MPKKTALIVLLLGVAIIIAALVNVFDMHGGLDFSSDTFVDEWPMERWILMGVGVLLGVWGAYSLSLKGKKK